MMKVLMTLMGLDIGGAETHVLELSRALADTGVEVTVASRGGVYVPELEKCGIRHVTLPLHTKNPIAVAKSYLGLKKLIKSEKFDIVHAHARIPAFICGMLQKKLHFRFVCSAHWVFEVNYLWKKIADWGDKTIAVSEDIKQYVIDNYGVFSDNISVTINGVDMKKFSADTECTALAAELGLPDVRKTIVYVSRMDTDRSGAARILAEIAPDLKKKHNDLQIIIVGNGDDFDYVKSLADKANSAVGETFVHMTGARTDINRFIALGDVFVGVSRAALEAMSASRPVVIAGNEGYIGIFDESKLDIAVATNFCCRGCEQTDRKKLLSDLETLLCANAQTLADEGEYNRALIEKNYSAKRMADDCLRVYRSLAPYSYRKYGDILLSGYYGFGNMGDDSLLLSIIKNLRAINPDVRITAFTRKPKKVTRKYGVKCVNRFNLPAVAKEIKHAKLLISGGGSLLQNNTSAKSLEYYILIMKMAEKQRLPVMVYANGIGPLYGDYSTAKVRSILEKVDLISLREPSSFELLKKIGLDVDVLTADGAKKTVVSADPALTLEPVDSARMNYILEKSGIDNSKNRYFAVSLREWHSLRTSDGSSSPSSFEDGVSLALADIYHMYGLIPVFVPIQKSYDEEICERVMAKTDAQCGCGKFMLSDLSAAELIAILGGMEIVIGMRLHMLIYATTVGIPAIGLSYDPKVRAFLEYACQPEALDANTVTRKNLTASVSSVLSERNEIRKTVIARNMELRSFVLGDAEKAMKLAGFVKR